MRFSLRLSCLLAPAATLALLTVSAEAHEYWLSPTRFAAHRGDTVSVAARVGVGYRGDFKPYAAARTTRLEVRTNKVSDVRALALNGGEEYARFVLPDDGGATVAFESNFADIQLPAAEFEAYLKLEGLDGPLRARAATGAAGPGRERYARCCRAWIAGSDAARATTPVGMTLELLPARDPSKGGNVAFRVALRGHPLAGARVRMWTRPLAADGGPRTGAQRDSLGPVFEARSDAQGLVTAPLHRPGEWLLTCVHMEPSTDTAEADWQSFWTSYAFAIRTTRRSK